jgi:hypothetical protein
MSKQVGDFHRITGDALKVGSFISNSGNKVDLTQNDIDLIYNNISEPVPMAIDHDDPNADPIAFAVKWDIVGDRLTYSGANFNSEALKSAVLMGYNSVSPEIDFTTDSTGKIIDAKISSLRFVKSPAIPTNTTSITRFAFSMPPEVTENMPEEQPTVETVTTPAQPATLDIEAVANLFNQVVMPKIEGMINEKFNSFKPQEPVVDKGKEFFNKPTEIPSTDNNQKETPSKSEVIESKSIDPVSKDVFDEYARNQAEIAKRDVELKQLREEVEKVKRKEYAEVRTELKNLGVSDPDKLVSHLGDYESKIQTLKAFKSSVVKTTPMNSNESVPPMSSEGGNDKKVSADKIFNDALRELHADPNSNYYRANADRFIKLIASVKGE